LFCVKKAKSLNLLFFTHSSQLAGAERTLIQLIKELTSDYGSICTVILPDSGPSINLLQEVGVSTIIAPLNWWCSPSRITERTTINKQYAQSFNWIVENL
jgi:hypothetical protein